MRLLSRLFGAAPAARLPLLQDGLGVFGKLPASGDFVSLGMDLGLRERLDEWLSRGMLALNEQTDGLKNYLQAPSWCGLLPAGLWAETELGLVLLPSVDRVGRYFPLCALLAPCADEGRSGLCARLQAAARVLPRALHEPLDVQALRTELLLAAATAPAFAMPLCADQSSSLWWPGLQGPQLLTQRGAPDASLLLRMLGRPGASA